MMRNLIRIKRRKAMNKSITLITGGSSGLGLEIARRHLLEGDNVCVLSRSRERLDQAEKELRSSGC
ncbi:MAG: SDR family NAD(P)-dependent oxidoreductase, partial [bacterium]|nr:SDR family NAD(P)-dependent oxidoreductase [bacterium]